MILHWWLLPLIAAVIACLGILYLIVDRTGGFGNRTAGRTMVDKEAEKPEHKGVGWNYYK